MASATAAALAAIEGCVPEVKAKGFGGPPEDILVNRVDPCRVAAGMVVEEFRRGEELHLGLLIGYPGDGNSRHPTADFALERFVVEEKLVVVKYATLCDSCWVSGRWRLNRRKKSP